MWRNFNNILKKLNPQLHPEICRQRTGVRQTVTDKTYYLRFTTAMNEQLRL